MIMYLSLNWMLNMLPDTMHSHFIFYFSFPFNLVHKVRAPKKSRGRSKMSKVHARGPDQKIVITLNALGQPISDDQKIVTELSNFLGTVAKDNVSLTYLNWHVVPDQLKNQMWEYTLVISP